MILRRFPFQIGKIRETPHLYALSATATRHKDRIPHKRFWFCVVNYQRVVTESVTTGTGVSLTPGNFLKLKTVFVGGAKVTFPSSGSRSGPLSSTLGWIPDM